MVSGIISDLNKETLGQKILKRPTYRSKHTRRKNLPLLNRKLSRCYKTTSCRSLKDVSIVNPVPHFLFLTQKRFRPRFSFAGSKVEHSTSISFNERHFELKLIVTITNRSNENTYVIFSM